MAKTYTTIDGPMKAFIESQHVFFVGTAPSGSDGHVNLSPKGMESLEVLAPDSVAYLDYVGSGIETIAHLKENGRIVIMLCAFDGPPKIVRLHGHGEVIEPPDSQFAQLRTRFGEKGNEHGLRSIIRVKLDRIGDSCGYGVPMYSYEGQRAQLNDWAAHRSDDELQAYQRKENVRSVDGLRALEWPDRKE